MLQPGFVSVGTVVELRAPPIAQAVTRHDNKPMTLHDELEARFSEHHPAVAIQQAELQQIVQRHLERHPLDSNGTMCSNVFLDMLDEWRMYGVCERVVQHAGSACTVPHMLLARALHKRRGELHELLPHQLSNRCSISQLEQALCKMRVVNQTQPHNFSTAKRSTMAHTMSRIHRNNDESTVRATANSCS